MVTAAADDIAEAFARLKRSGWSIGSTSFHDGAGGLAWLVSGSNGENIIRAGGPTEASAWRTAVDQARTVGMCGGFRLGDPGPG